MIDIVSLASDFEKQSFKDCLNGHLAAVEIPRSLLICNNVQCKDDLHIQESDKYVILP